MHEAHEDRTGAEHHEANCVGSTKHTRSERLENHEADSVGFTKHTRLNRTALVLFVAAPSAG
jgi:hypothetical protein